MKIPDDLGEMTAEEQEETLAGLLETAAEYDKYRAMFTSLVGGLEKSRGHTDLVAGQVLQWLVEYLERAELPTTGNFTMAKAEQMGVPREVVVEAVIRADPKTNPSTDRKTVRRRVRNNLSKDLKRLEPAQIQMCSSWDETCRLHQLLDFNFKNNEFYGLERWLPRARVPFWRTAWETVLPVDGLIVDRPTLRVGTELIMSRDFFEPFPRKPYERRLTLVESDKETD
jgi:hypothetical protein